MPEYCTCGAELPPNARFCHRCGRPLREEFVIDEPVLDVPEQMLPRFEPPTPIVRPPGSIGFHNAQAVRLGFLTGMLSVLLIFLLFFACPVWLVAAGFLGVFLYQRRTGESLSVSGGARMGWITGLFSFLIFSVFASFAVISQLRTGEFFDNLREVPFFGGQADQVMEMFQNPVYLALNLLFSFFVLFVLFSLFSITGGALGAKVLGRN